MTFSKYNPNKQTEKAQIMSGYYVLYAHLPLTLTHTQGADIVSEARTGHREGLGKRLMNAQMSG